MRKLVFLIKWLWYVRIRGYGCYQFGVEGSPRHKYLFFRRTFRDWGKQHTSISKDELLEKIRQAEKDMVWNPPIEDDPQ